MKSISVRYNEKANEFEILFVWRAGVSECACISSDQADKLAEHIKNRTEGVI